MTHAERATAYATDVVEGRVLACRYVQLACQRHLDDLEAGVYVFDHGKANAVCRFIELMPHVKGKWAGEQIRLEHWQCFVVCCLFGWVRADGRRRFRRAYIEVPRKNAKSTILACLGLYMLAADEEPGSEVYCGAGSEIQAWEVFRPAKQMAERTPAFTDHFGVQVNAKALVIPGAGNRFVPVIGKPGDGASPHCAIVDEYHEHNTPEQYETFNTGMGAREQPLLGVITTAGADTGGPCYALRQETVDVLEGHVENPEFFGAVWTIDADDDWTTPEVLIKANPNYGVSVGAEFLLSQQRDAINDPRKQSAFLTKHLNVWVGSASPFFNIEKWVRLGDSALDMTQFGPFECYIGVDLAAKVDLTAVVHLFRREIDGEDHYYVFPRIYCPEEKANDPAVRRYAAWAFDGHIIATPGNITDFDRIQSDLEDTIASYNVVHLAFDPWNSMQMSSSIAERTGAECVDIPMTVKHLSDPTKWLQALIEDARIHHDANPCMSWMMGNVVAREDHNGNVFPRKEKDKREAKVDGPIALIMAMERGFQKAVPGSYLDEADVEWLE